MKRAAIYIRVSTDRQVKDGDSIPAQKDALTRYVLDKPDYVLAGVYIDDGVSGTKMKRDELQRMLADVKKGLIDIICFTKLDRWFRSIRHYTATQEILDKYNVGWLAIWEPIYDTTTPQGRLIVNQMMSIAQFEAENTSQRIKQVLAYKASVKQAISGNQPPGYKIQDKKVVPDDTMKNVAIQMFEHYSRYGNLNGTLKYCSEVLGVDFNKKSLRHHLMNRKYIGEFRGIKNYCEPLISDDLFDDVQRKLSLNVKRSQKHTYVFSGLVVCTACGMKCSGKTSRGKYKFYYCDQHVKRTKKACSNNKIIMENRLEQYVIEHIKPEAEKYILEYTILQKEKPIDNSKRIATLKKRIDRLKELYLNELMTLEEYKEERIQLENDIEALTIQSKEVVQKDFSKLKETLNSGVIDTILSLSEEERRFIWRSIIKEIKFYPDRHIEIIFL